jgi:hypothetical protein
MEQNFKGFHGTLIYLIDADQNQKPVFDFKSCLFSVHQRPKKRFKEGLFVPTKSG